MTKTIGSITITITGNLVEVENDLGDLQWKVSGSSPERARGLFDEFVSLVTSYNTHGMSFDALVDTITAYPYDSVVE